MNKRIQNSPGPYGLDKKIIEEIRKTYLSCNSIQKTAAKTGYGKGTVNKYVKDLSSRKKEILKILPQTGETIETFSCLEEAEQKTGQSKSALCHCLSGRTKTCGGYKYEYRKEG